MTRFVSVCLAMAAWCMLTSVAAHAEELHFKVYSKYNDDVKIAFNSTTRDHTWPQPGSSYKLSTDTLQSINISCQPGEHICYGAWVETNTKISWGVGYKNARPCTSCCYYCDGGSPRITLNR